MKPVRLFMKNIGPYRAEEVDFTKLDNIFLITGNTGAGKTFIFDAITFSLYGSLKGNRDGFASELKSRYAAESEESYVDFTFESAGQTYSVHRTVPFVYQKRTGSSGKKTSEVDFCHLENGKFVSYGEGLDSTNNRIRNIIGLDANEFAQVVLLPQGAFAEFLKQNSKERGQTLKKLFPVESYSRIMQQVREKAAGLKKELEILTESINRNSLNHDFSNAEEKLSAMRNELEKLADEEKKLQAMRTDLAGKISRIDEKYKASKSAEERVLREKLALENAEKSLFRIKSELSELESQTVQMESLKEKTADDSVQLTKLEERLKSAGEYQSGKKQMESAMEKCSAYKQKKMLLSEKIGSVSEYFKGCSPEEAVQSLSEKLIALERDYNSAKELVDSAKKRDALFERKTTLLSELEKLNEKHLHSVELVRRNQQTLEELKNQNEKNLRSNAAFVLSSILKPDCPCPVCGSTEHPAPACGQESLLDLSEQIKTGEANLQMSQENANRLQNDISVKKDNFQTAENELEQFDGLMETPAVLEKASSIKKEQEQTYNNLHNARDAQKQLVQLKKELEDSSELLSAAESDFKAWSAKVELLSKTLFADSNETLEALSQKKDFLSKKIKSDEKLYSDWNNAVQEKRQNHSSALANREASAAHYEQAVAEKSRLPDSLTFEEERISLNNNSLQLESEYNRIRSLLDSKSKEKIEYENDWKKICLAEKERAVKEKALAPLKRLDEDLNGQNPNKIQFDAWALGMYFEQVVEFASDRFEEISNGRFRFKLKDVASEEKKGSNRGLKGLDLQVFDGFTGKFSDPKELSGGETFEASISLALAITDVVQNNNGGIQLDSLFIDEGFGTLDGETLDKAMEIFQELQETKMIGIISHVEALEQGIASKIEVKKTNSGSAIYVK